MSYGWNYKQDAKICNSSSLTKNVINTNVPQRLDVVIVDGFVLLHSMQNVPKTFGQISKQIMKKLTNMKAPRVHIIFDQYFSPSIKDYERTKRHEERCTIYTITGPQQVKPVDFLKELRNIQFKEAFVEFLIHHWSTDEMVPFIGNTEINLNFKYCHRYSVENNSVISIINRNLCCGHHEEADTKKIYHICQIN